MNKISSGFTSIITVEIFVDLERDTIEHEILLQKLMHSVEIV